MMRKKRIKRSMTLIEIMVVITLIGIVGGALAINMRSSIHKGKVFQSEQHCARVYDALMMAYVTNGDSLQEIVNNKESILKNAAWGKDTDKMLKDAWGNDIVVQVDKSGNDLEVFSPKLRKQSSR